MIRVVIANRLDAAERHLGVPADYLHHMLDVSLRAFLRFSKVFSLASYRRRLPADVFHVARLVATRDEDCGTCVQIEVNLAKKDGVPVEILRAALARKPEVLPEHLADAYRFADEVVRATGAEGELRERIRRRHGDEALCELAIAIAACRVFPVTKRALGYAQSCAVVPVHV